jgi:hypothetical protein
MMSVATCDQPAGMSMSIISNTFEPSGLRMTELRFTNSMFEYGPLPAWVNRRVIFIGLLIPLDFFSPSSVARSLTAR